MAEEIEEIKELSAEEKEKLKKLLEKDSKSFRTPAGFWKWAIAILGAIMVVFYFYSAGLKAVATQYHRGLYVFITFVLVFLLYPAGRRYMRWCLALLLGIISAGAAATLLLFGSAAEFRARLGAFGDLWSDQGMGAALGGAGSLWLVAIAALLITAVLILADSQMVKRWPHCPTLSDIGFALTAAA